MRRLLAQSKLQPSLATKAPVDSGWSGEGGRRKKEEGEREVGTNDKAVDLFFGGCRKLTVAKVQNDAQSIFKATKDTRQCGRAPGGRGCYARSGTS